LGRKRLFRSAIIMSALPPKADMCGATRDVRFGPIADIPLLDHLVGTIKQRWRHSKPECLGGLQVNHQFEFGGGLHRQVSGLLAFKDAINVTSSFAVWINRVWPITDQATVGAVRGERIDCWQSISGCERDDQIAIINNQGGC
jgi:hypothetical protein